MCQYGCENLGPEYSIQLNNGHRVCYHNNFFDQYPEIAKGWHPIKNNSIDKKSVACGSGKRYWWLCSICSHEWQAPVIHRTKGSGCPKCAGKYQETLDITHPHLIAQWHPDNYLKPDQVTAGMSVIIKWQCPIKIDHIWVSSINNRTSGGSRKKCNKSGTGCPYCVGQKVCISNSLAINYPHLIPEWHKDNNLSPYEVSPCSTHMIKWQCQRNINHVWFSRVDHRTCMNSSCPKCKRSKGEEACELFLLKYNILFNTQHHIISLPNRFYDFIFIYNNIRFLLEFDGEQHFYYMLFFNGSNYENFMEKQEIDRIKTWDCLDEGYKIIRLSYKTLYENSLESHLIKAIQILSSTDQLYYFSHDEDYKFLLE